MQWCRTLKQAMVDWSLGLYTPKNSCTMFGWLNADNQIEKLSLVTSCTKLGAPFQPLNMYCNSSLRYRCIIAFRFTPVKWSRNWSCYYPLDLVHTGARNQCQFNMGIPLQPYSQLFSIVGNSISKWELEYCVAFCLLLAVFSFCHFYYYTDDYLPLTSEWIGFLFSLALCESGAARLSFPVVLLCHITELMMAGSKEAPTC